MLRARCNSETSKSGAGERISSSILGSDRKIRGIRISFFARFQPIQLQIVDAQDVGELRIERRFFIYQNLKRTLTLDVSEHGQSHVRGSGLLGVHSTDDGRAVIDHLLAVEGALNHII